jgi:choline dehydrogenase
MITHSLDDRDEKYDFVVVGSGAGGGPVAVNLAKAGYRVLILEAGGEDQPLDYKVPAFHSLSTEHRALAWKFYVQHYADKKLQRRDKINFLNNKKIDRVKRTGIFYPRAGTLGGCTAHHAMIFIAPHNSDWNYIAKVTRDRSWKAKSMRKYFQRIERCQYMRRPWLRRLSCSRHGYDGWLPTTLADPSLLMRDSTLLQLVSAAIQTCFAAQVWYSQKLRRRFNAVMESYLDLTGLRRVGALHRTVRWLTSLLDPNDWQRLQERAEGPTLVPLTVSNGMRFGTRELIRDAERRMPANLTVKLNSLAIRVLLEKNVRTGNKRAIGVEFVEGKHLYRADPAARHAGPPIPGNKKRTIRPRYEVILAGGAFNTPQLLMLSGIGPREELERHGIKVEVDLPGVGRNLQDRIEIGIVHRMNADFELLKHADLRPDDREFADWRNGHGLYTTNGVILAIIKKSNLGQPDPDLFLFAIPGHFSGYRPGYSKMGRKKRYFTWVILKGHTHNAAGRVLLGPCIKSGVLSPPDPRDPPSIDFKYFDKTNDYRNDDLDAVVAGIEFVRKITGRTASLFREIIPGRHKRTRAEVAQFVKDGAWGHHACGTCKIGADKDEEAVLDSRFRVRKVEGLRVVDASIFPKIPGFFILSAIYMAAEKASDTIIEDTRRRHEKPAR